MPTEGATRAQLLNRIDPDSTHFEPIGHGLSSIEVCSLDRRDQPERDTIRPCDGILHIVKFEQRQHWPENTV